MSTLELLRREPQPSEERIRAWLKGNFCRCTGYQHIVDAIVAAGETTVARRDGAATAAQTSRFVGQSLTRREDDHHLRGRGRFTDDVRSADPAGSLHVALLRSRHAHARIRLVSVERAVKMPGVVTVVTGRGFGRHGGTAADELGPARHAGSGCTGCSPTMWCDSRGKASPPSSLPTPTPQRTRPTRSTSTTSRCPR